MRLIVFLMTTAALCGPAVAEDCVGSHADILTLDQWQVREGDRGTEVSFTYTNTSGKRVEMADGAIWFRDALDRSIGGIGIEPDPQLDEGENLTETRTMMGMGRLLKVDRENISAYLCVDAALFGDGTKIEAEDPMDKLHSIMGG